MMGAATRAAAQDLDAAVPPARSESAPEVVSPPPGNPRFPLMDSLRALAALGVVLAHVTIFTGNAQRLSWGVIPGNLDVGVSVFFVLSGFLLFRPFCAADLDGRRPPRVRAYLRRRILRIVPAYWLALTVLAIYPGISGVFSADWWRYYGFLQFYSYRTSIRGLGVAWTLCVEVAFYVCLPIYASGTRRLTARLDRGHRALAQVALLAVLSVGSIVLRIADQGVVMQNSLMTHFYWFALGMSLAIASAVLAERGDAPRAVRMIIARPGLCWLAALIVFLTMCAVLTNAPQHLYYSVTQAVWQYLLSGLIAALLVAPAIFGDSAGGWPRRALGWSWLARLGLISYGIYLWHATIAITFISHDIQAWLPVLIGDLVVTIAVASISYVFVERPILRYKDRRRPRDGSAIPETPMVSAGG